MKGLFRIYLIFQALVLVLLSCLPTAVGAISPKDKHAVIYDTTYYEDCGNSPQGGAATPGQVYFLGDSIGVGVKSAGFEDELTAAGWQPVKMNVEQGRPLTAAASAINNDKEFIKDAKSIVVELGTNVSGSGEVFAQQITDTVSLIRSINNSALIYWVDIGSKSNPIYPELNQTIYDQRTKNGYEVIDWAKTNPPLAGDNIHPTPEGYSALSKLVASTVSGGASNASQVSSATEDCCKVAIGVGTGELPDTVPEPYKTIFENASVPFNTPAALVAAIFYAGEHGSSWPDPNGPWASSSAGASGPFQFIPGTWDAYGVDGNNDGVKDIQNLEDAAFGAANYLAANGGVKGGIDGPVGQPSIQNAIFNYNHAMWYVDMVFSAYQQFLTGGSVTSSPLGPQGGCGGGLGVGPDGLVFPIQGTKELIQLGNGSFTWCYQSENNCHHDYNAADIAVETGTPVVAAKGGTILTAKQDAGKYGATIRIAGDDGFWYYYAHLARGSLTVTSGMVEAGQVLGVVGTAADAENTSPHIHFDISPVENGFSRPGPLDDVLINPQPTLIAAYNNLPER